MKLLVLSNENPAGAHDDVHRAIKNCQNKGLINDNLIYPFLARLAEVKKEKEVIKEIVEISKNYKPELTLWMHTGKFKVSRNTLDELYSLKTKSVMGYWDGDIYQDPFMSVPNEVLELSSACDVVFVQGFGEMSKKMIDSGCKDVRYVPAFGDEKRFYPIKSDLSKEYDIIMIGNNVESRNPFRKNLRAMDLRKNIIYKFSDKYKNKFAVFGNNWKSYSAKGAINYLDQHKIYSSSRIAISVNNANAKYYFSDRLPIAMLSGVPIVQNYEEGFEELFNDCNEIKLFKTIEEAFEQCEELLDKSDAELYEIGQKLLKYTLKKFTANIVFNYMIEVLKEKYESKNKGIISNAVLNPWLY